MRSLSPWASLFALAACGTRQPNVVDVGEVAADGRSDAIAAVVKYQHRAVGLRGKVLEKGAVSVNGPTKITGSTGGGPYGQSVSLEASWSQENAGRLVLASADGRPGTARCYFPNDELEELATIRVGTVVQVWCLFRRYDERSDATGVFGQCHLAQ